MSGTPSRAGHGPTRPIEGPSDADALVLAAPSAIGGHCPCSREAHDGTAAATGTSAFLRVAFTRGGLSPPGEWVRAAEDGADVRVVDSTPCAVGSGESGEREGEEGVVTVTASGPANLTDVGVRVTDALDDMDATAGDTGGGSGGPVCCLGSLTALLQYVDDREAYRFVNAVTARVASLGGTTHAHIEPAAHDRRTIDTMASLFDVVAEPSSAGDGLDVVRSRRR